MSPAQRIVLIALSFFYKPLHELLFYFPLNQAITLQRTEKRTNPARAYKQVKPVVNETKVIMVRALNHTKPNSENQYSDFMNGPDAGSEPFSERE